jgi:hypothetical protein
MGTAGGRISPHCPDRHSAARADRPGRRGGHRAVSLLRRDRDLRDRADPAQRQPPRTAPARRARDLAASRRSFRFGLQFSDGGKAAGGPGSRRPDHDSEPAGPVLYPFAGGGGPHSFISRWWMWPLPPAGPLEFVCEWPAFGIAESRTGIDAQLILDAAASRSIKARLLRAFGAGPPTTRAAAGGPNPADHDLGLAWPVSRRRPQNAIVPDMPDSHRRGSSQRPC